MSWFSMQVEDYLLIDSANRICVEVNEKLGNLNKPEYVESRVRGGNV
jgi:hypothetical protein